MDIRKVVNHAATAYLGEASGWTLQIGELEKVKGVKINAVTSCLLEPAITQVSGGACTVTFMNSGTTWNSGSLLGGVDFFVIAEGY